MVLFTPLRPASKFARGVSGWPWRRLGLLTTAASGIVVAGAVFPARAQCHDDGGGALEKVPWKSVGLAASAAAAAAWVALRPCASAAVDTEAWIKRWEIGQTNFHLESLHPALQKFGARLLDDGISAPHFPKRILFPMCGKAVDMPFLSLSGHHVVGVDCAKLALDQLVTETKGASVARESFAGPLQVTGKWLGQCVRAARTPAQRGCAMSTDIDIWL